MKYKLLILVFGIFLISFVSAESYWVTDPTSCPTIYQSQTCTGSNIVCGYSGGITFCSDPSTITAPTSTASSNTDYSASYNGGYLIDCYAYSAPSPYCRNGGSYWCDRNSTCYSTKYRNTNCTANVFGASTCGACRSSYLDCTGDDVCEILSGTTTYTQPNTTYLTCTTGQCASGWVNCTNALESGGCNEQIGVTTCTDGGVPGTYAADCSCTPLSQEHFITNTEASGYGSNLLWGVQTNPTGNLMNLTNSSGSSLIIDNNGCIHFADGSILCTNLSLDSKADYNFGANNFTGTGNFTTIGWISGLFSWVIDSLSLNYLYFNGTTLSMSTNVTKWLYNMSDGSYNATYAGLINNASYLSTYNATYDKWSYNETSWVVAQNYLSNGTNAWFNTLTVGTSTLSPTYTAEIQGHVLINGNLTVLGNTSFVSLQTLIVNGSWIPEYDAQFDLGNSSNRFRNASFSNNVNVDGDVIIGGSSVKPWLYNQTDAAMTYGNATWVPYTGATTNVDLGVNNLTTTGIVNAGFDSRFGNANRYVEIKEFDATNTALGDLGYISYFKATTDGPLSGVVFEDGLVLTKDDDLPQITFTNSTLSGLGIIKYDVASNLFTITSDTLIDAGLNVSAGNDICIDGGNCLSTSDSTYNETYAGLIQNASYLSTYNASYVPYVGANQNVNLGNNNFSANVIKTEMNGGSLWISSSSSGGKIQTYNSKHLVINPEGNDILMGSGGANVNISGQAYINGANVNKWLYNETYSGSTYNSTYAGLINNASYLSTYNESYVPYTGATQDLNMGSNDVISYSVDAQRYRLMGTNGTYFDAILSAATSPHQHFHLFPNYISQGGDTLIISGYNSNITRYDWYSKATGKNTRLMFLQSDGQLNLTYGGNVNRWLYNQTTAGSSLYVPYSGATQDVDLGAFGIQMNNLYLHHNGTAGILQTYSSTDLYLNPEGNNVYVGTELVNRWLYNQTIASTGGSLYIPYTGATQNVNLGIQNFNTTGNLGIGNIYLHSGNEYGFDTNPDVTLTEYYGPVLKVGGASSSYSFKIEKSDATEIMRVGGNGNVGIGTKNPGYILDVNGSDAGGYTIRAEDGIYINARGDGRYNYTKIYMDSKKRDNSGGAYWVMYADADGAITGTNEFSIWGYPRNTSGSTTKFDKFLSFKIENYNETEYTLEGTAYNKSALIQTHKFMAGNGATNISYDSRSGIFKVNNIEVNQWLYNQTYSGSTYNSTYAGLIQNSSYLSTYNATYHGLIQNASYLSTYNETYVIYAYNQTTPFTDWLSTFLYNYNQTYSGSTFNETYATWLTNYTEYGKYWYNMTTSSSGTYNETYAIWSYNQTTPFTTWLSTFLYNYNQTIGAITDINSRFWNRTQTYNITEINIFNSSWTTTYNATYDNYAYNQSTGYVPYIGATQDLNLGNSNITAYNMNSTGNLYLNGSLRLKNGAAVMSDETTNKSIGFNSGGRTIFK